MASRLRRVPAAKNPYNNQKVGSVTFSAGTETSNVIRVTCTLKDLNGQAVSEVLSLPFYLTDDAAGTTVVATAPDGGFASGASGKVQTITTGKAGRLVFTAAGVCHLDVTHAAGAKTVYVVAVLPDGSLSKSTAVTFA